MYIIKLYAKVKIYMVKNNAKKGTCLISISLKLPSFILKGTIIAQCWNTHFPWRRCIIQTVVSPKGISYIKDGRDC